MSDYEDEFEYEDDVDLEYECADGEETRLENLFYDADDCKASAPLKALEMFRTVAESNSNWKFKALVNTIALCCRLGQLNVLASDLARLMQLLDSSNRNELSDGLFTVLDSMDVLYDQNHQILIDGLTCILNEMESRQSSPFAVWFSAASRLSKLLLDKGDLASTQAIIEKMKASCRDADGCDDILSKASQLVDVYALGVRLVDMTGASDGVKRMKQILARCEKVNAAVCNPRSAGVLREYAGKILMQQGRYDDAYNEFYEAFRAFSDAGQTRGKKLLKYAVVANILSLSNINPFDCREAKAYQTDPDLTDIASLRKAVDEGDLGAVHSLATSPRFFESEDSWLEPYGLKIVIEIKQKYLERILPAYASVEIESLARRINEDPGTTRKMLKILILDNRVRGSLIEDRFVAKRSVDGDKSQENEMITSSKYMCTYTEELLDQGITVGSK